MWLSTHRFILLLIILLLSKFSANISLKNVQTFPKHHMQPSLPDVPSNNCTTTTCDILRVMSQLYPIIKSPDVTSKESNLNALGKIDPEKLLTSYVTEYMRLVKSVRQIERRVRAVEQPVWRLAPGSNLEWNRCSSGGCDCNPDIKSFNCWGTNLKSLPVMQVIPMNIVSIQLSRNLLSTFHKNTFRGLTLLQDLDLSYNQLDFLPFDLFRDLDGLVQLHLHNNRLEDLDSEIFQKLRQLRVIDISKNALTNLPDNIFNHIQRLTIIRLSNNKIKSFPQSLLRDQLSLEELDMSQNEIPELLTDSMRNLKELKILDFSWNAIDSIADDFFGDLKELRTLMLNNNRLTVISRNIFEKLEQLVRLDLTTNRISEIDERAFAKLSNLQELLLGQNLLTHIPAGLFVNAVSLTRLSLFSNNLTTLEADDFRGLSHLRQIMLNNNFLKSLDVQAFAPLVNLEKLRLDSNRLKYLPHGILTGLHKLSAIKMNKNPWYCDCRALYLARWIREFHMKLWDERLRCSGPGDLNGHDVSLLRYNDLCDGQWASMLSLSPRLPVRKNRFTTSMNYTDYFNLYLKHIYTTLPPTDKPMNKTEKENVDQE